MFFLLRQGNFRLKQNSEKEQKIFCLLSESEEKVVKQETGGMRGGFTIQGG